MAVTNSRARRWRTLARAAMVSAGLALGAVPARPALGCEMAPVPAYPGAQQIGGAGGSSIAAAPGPGGSRWGTDDPLANIQQFYYTRLLNAGWGEVAQLPGQYIEQFGGLGGSTSSGNVPAGVLEFARDDGRQRVRVVGEAGGFSLWLDCRD